MQYPHMEKLAAAPNVMRSLYKDIMKTLDNKLSQAVNIKIPAEMKPIADKIRTEVKKIKSEAKKYHKKQPPDSAGLLLRNLLMRANAIEANEAFKTR